MSTSKPVRMHDLSKRRSAIPSDSVILNALNTAIDLQPMSLDHMRMARYTARVLLPAVRKLIEDAVRSINTEAAS